MPRNDQSHTTARPAPARTNTSTSFRSDNHIREHAQRSVASSSYLDQHTDKKSAAKPVNNSQPNVSSAVDPKVFSKFLFGASSRELTIGSRGPEVIELKKLLNGVRSGWHLKLDITSDVFDDKTAAAVARFQKNHALSKDFKVYDKPGLTPDGIAGKWTVTALLVKNGFSIHPKNAKDLVTRLNQIPGEKWFEVAPQKPAAVKPTVAVQKPEAQKPAVAAINQTKFALEYKAPFSKEKFPFQQHSYDCGPTACATALGIITGKNKEALAVQFRNMQGATGMDWNNPHKFAKQAGVACIQLDTSNPETIARYLRSGCTAVVSIKKGSPLTENGHILALHKTKGSGSTLEFENLDPNVRNLPRYSVLPGNQIASEVKQVWIFGSRELLASLSGKRQYPDLASR